MATPVHAQDDMGRERRPARCELAQRLFAPARAEGLNADQLPEAQACLGFVEGFLWGHTWASWRGAKDTLALVLSPY